MQVSVISHRDSALQHIHSEIAAALDRVGAHLVSLCKDAVGAPSPPTAKPGHPPHKESRGRHPGLGQASISMSRFDGFNAHILRVGIPPEAFWMGYHEHGIAYPTIGQRKGSRGVQQRPWLASTLRKNRASLRRDFIGDR